jgi:D-serine deaminase-like pyridoxal phosphate-dependent protein
MPDVPTSLYVIKGRLGFHDPAEREEIIRRLAEHYGVTLHAVLTGTVTVTSTEEMNDLDAPATQSADLEPASGCLCYDAGADPRCQILRCLCARQCRVLLATEGTPERRRHRGSITDPEGETR